MCRMRAHYKTAAAHQALVSGRPLGRAKDPHRTWTAHTLPARADTCRRLLWVPSTTVTCREMILVIGKEDGRPLHKRVWEWLSRETRDQPPPANLPPRASTSSRCSRSRNTPRPFPSQSSIMVPQIPSCHGASWARPEMVPIQESSPSQRWYC